MTDDTDTTPTIGQFVGTRPAALADQLRWVHDMLRRDLATIRHLAVRVRDGVAVGEIQAELRDLRSNGPLFQLRVNCLSYCRTLGSHHGNEDELLFPAVRRAAPHLAATVDRLEADHLVVSAILEEIEELAHDLAAETARDALVRALEDLSANLLEHLELEEAALQPVLESWGEWPIAT